MVKITFADGSMLEGTIDELKRIGVEFTKEEVPQPEPEPLKFGDYAKVVGYTEILKPGDIVEIRDNIGAFDFRCFRIEDGESELFNKVDLIRATDEEVAEAKRKKAEVEKWAKIGRKSNEFKKGDVVRVTSTTGGHPIGTIGELVDAPTYYIGTKLAVQALGNTRSHIGQIELITPVEARFDV